MTAFSVAVVGVGHMGANLARRLRDTGHHIAAVYDVDQERCAVLAAELGSEAAPTLGEATARAEAVLTVVSDDAAMAAIYAPTGDSLLAGAAGRLFINTATVHPATHVAAAQAVADRGGWCVEACMLGTLPHARAGTLHLLVAGPDGSVARARPLLAHLGQITYVGGPGKAAELKALVNMVMNIHMAALAEALALGEAFGFDLGLVQEVLASSAAASQVLQIAGEGMARREYPFHLAATHAAKDAAIAHDLARQAGLDLPLAEATLAQYRHLTELGLGALDHAAVAELTFRDRRGRGRERDSEL